MFSQKFPKTEVEESKKMSKNDNVLGDRYSKEYGGLQTKMT
jgi:hypothetical protein